jgi:hypothetical protein
MNAMAEKHRRVTHALVQKGSEAVHAHSRDSIGALHHGGTTFASEPGGLLDIFVPCEFHLTIFPIDQTVERRQVLLPSLRIRSQTKEHVKQQALQARQVPDEVFCLLFGACGDGVDGLHRRVVSHRERFVVEVATHTPFTESGHFQEAGNVAMLFVQHVLGECLGVFRLAVTRPYSDVRTE